MKKYKYRVWFDGEMSGYEKVSATQQDEERDEECYYYYTKREAIKVLKDYLRELITHLRVALKRIS